jgi:nucleoprotein TPR
LIARNKQLLSVVRHLSESKAQGLENSALKEDEENKKAIENVILELETMRESRGKLEELLKSVIQQRDMYRIILGQNDQKYSQLDSSQCKNEKKNYLI